MTLAKNHGRQSIGVLVTLAGILIVWAISAYLISFIPIVGPIIATASFALVPRFHSLLCTDLVAGAYLCLARI